MRVLLHFFEDSLYKIPHFFEDKIRGLLHFFEDKRIILLRHGKTVPIRLSNTEHADCTGFFATRFGPTKMTELAEPVSIACSFCCLLVVGQLLLVSS